MILKKIIANNFIIPGIQTYEFDSMGGLISGNFFSLNEIPILEKLLNGEWLDYSLSFEKFYPKFSDDVENMDLEIDALIEFDKDELKYFNENVSKELGYRNQESLLWYYSIKCYYPYIFPIVTLKPAEFKKDKTFAFGSHYDKFIKLNASKKDILTAAGINAVAQFRKKYYEYKDLVPNPIDRYLNDEYLKLLRSIFRYDEYFIQKIGKLLYQIDDGDVLNYGDQFDFFYEHKVIVNWFDSIEILKESLEIRLDFAELMYDFYFKDLQWSYKIKSSNDIVEIRKLLFNIAAEKAVDFKVISNIFNFNLSEVPIEEFVKEDIDKELNKDVEVSLEKTTDLSSNIFTDDERVVSQMLEEFQILKDKQSILIQELENKVDNIAKDYKKKKNPFEPKKHPSKLVKTELNPRSEKELKVILQNERKKLSSLIKEKEKQGILQQKEQLQQDKIEFERLKKERKESKSTKKSIVLDYNDENLPKV